jgi:hypothetical protein
MIFSLSILPFTIIFSPEKYSGKILVIIFNLKFSFPERFKINDCELRLLLILLTKPVKLSSREIKLMKKAVQSNTD